MAYVKLDCGILDSTLWFDRDLREIFITALLMAEPYELSEPARQIQVDSLKDTGFIVPPGWYGFVSASGPGIIDRAKVNQESGIQALIKLGSPEEASRTPDFEGRRLVRVDGGYIVLNYDKYRNKDHTAAERARRYRERKASRVMSTPSRVSNRSVTQAEAEAEAEAEAVPKQERAREIPDLKTVLTYAQLQGIAPWKAEDWFNEMEGCGWLDFKSRPIQDWQAVLRRVRAKWEADGRPMSPPSRPTSIGGNGVKSILDLKSVLQAKETLANEIKERWSSNSAMGLNWSNAEKRQEYIAIRREIKELNSKLANMA